MILLTLILIPWLVALVFFLLGSRLTLKEIAVLMLTQILLGVIETLVIVAISGSASVGEILVAFVLAVVSSVVGALYMQAQDVFGYEKAARKPVSRR